MGGQQDIKGYYHQYIYIHETFTTGFATCICICNCIQRIQFTISSKRVFASYAAISINTELNHREARHISISFHFIDFEYKVLGK